MKENLKSWEFLFDFYQHDKSIVELINQALAVSSKIKVRNENYDILIEDILSLFPNNADKKSYKDFLSYATLDNQEDFIEIEDLENKFLKHIFWGNILRYFPKKDYIKLNTLSDKHIPYLILYSVNITQDWFLYGKDYTFYGNSLQKAYKRWRISFYFNKHYIFSKLFWTKQLSAKQLFPLATLFIVLRREWEYSKTWNKIIRDNYSKTWNYSDRWDRIKTNYYVSLKYNYVSLKYNYFKYADSTKKTGKSWINSLYNHLNKDAYSTKETGKALIYSLYNHFKEADEELKQQINTDKKNNDIPTIELHPLVAKHIIESNAYQFLFDIDNSGNIFHSDNMGFQYVTPLDKEDNYFRAEDRLDEKEKHGAKKRFLIDYMFPYTEIRANDIFKPSSAQLTDYIFLSFHKGISYKSILREHKENERFDVIQIEPNDINTSGEKEYDQRFSCYRDYLKPQGEFNYVSSNEEYNIRKKIKEAFSNFRHDTKTVTTDVNIKILQLQNEFKSTTQYEKIRKTVTNIERFVNAPHDLDLLKEIRESVKVLDNDHNLHKTINNRNFSDIIYTIRDSIENYAITNSSESLHPVSKHISDIKQILLDCCIESFLRCIEIANGIDYSHNILCTYIDGTCNHGMVNTGNINICEYLNKFINKATLAMPVSLMLEYNVSNNCIVKYDKAKLYIILKSIMDNAVRHGFQNYDCEEPPKIKFILQDSGDYLLLKVCNNGRPIDIRNEEFKTRGIFKSETGHTGYGGYLISKYAEMQGGYVEIPKNKEWNTEIHLYLKK